MGRRGFSNTVRFDPNAFDADNDGRVQDSTPFERPAIRKPSAPLSDRGTVNWDEPGGLDDGMGWDLYDWRSSNGDVYVYEFNYEKNPMPFKVYVKRGSKRIYEESFTMPKYDEEKGKEKAKQMLKDFNAGKTNPKPQKPSIIQPMLAPGASSTGSKPPKSKANKVLDAINKNASKEKFDAEREYTDYETKFPKHEVDGTMRRDTADLPKMREMMKDLIKESQSSGVNYSAFSKMSDADLQEFWSTLNSMKDPETRAQFLAMMLADFEIGLRKLARDRAKTGPAPFEDKDKVEKIIKNLTGRGLI